MVYHLAEQIIVGKVLTNKIPREELLKAENNGGHSQFKNIMHRKGAQDAKKAKMFAKLAREITVDQIWITRSKTKPKT